MTLDLDPDPGSDFQPFCDSKSGFGSRRKWSRNTSNAEYRWCNLETCSHFQNYLNESLKILEKSCPPAPPVAAAAAQPHAGLGHGGLLGHLGGLVDAKPIQIDAKFLSTLHPPDIKK